MAPSGLPKNVREPNSVTTYSANPVDSVMNERYTEGSMFHYIGSGRLINSLRYNENVKCHGSMRMFTAVLCKSKKRDLD